MAKRNKDNKAVGIDFIGLKMMTSRSFIKRLKSFCFIILYVFI